MLERVEHGSLLPDDRIERTVVVLAGELHEGVDELLVESAVDHRPRRRIHLGEREIARDDGTGDAGDAGGDAVPERNVFAGADRLHVIEGTSDRPGLLCQELEDGRRTGGCLSRLRLVLAFVRRVLDLGVGGLEEPDAVAHLLCGAADRLGHAPALAFGGRQGVAELGLLAFVGLVVNLRAQLRDALVGFLEPLSGLRLDERAGMEVAELVCPVLQLRKTRTAGGALDVVHGHPDPHRDGEPDGLGYELVPPGPQVLERLRHVLDGTLLVSGTFVPAEQALRKI